MEDDETPDGTEPITVTTALPSFELPDFEGTRPVGVVTKLNGAGERIQRAMHLGERGVLLVEYEVANVGHSSTKGGVKRAHTLKVLDLYELEGKPGRRLLNAARQAYRTADNERHGRPLDGLLAEHAAGAGWRITPEGYTDASGRPITAEELAEIQGTKVAAKIEASANDPALDPVALVFGDGSRALWPDDYPASEAGNRPHAGEFFGDLQVVEVLDGISGEPLETWTPEQEDARLKALEDAALAEEAAGNADAFAEIQAARGLGPDGSPLEQVDPPEADAGAHDDGSAFEEDDPFVGLPGDDGKEIKAANGSAPPDGELEVDAAEVDAVPADPDPADPDEEEPFDGYSKLTVEQIKARIGAITIRDRVFEVAAYEEAHKKRKGVLEALGRRAAEIFSDEAPREELPSAEETGAFEVPVDAIETEEAAEDALARQYAGAEAPGGDDE